MEVAIPLVALGGLYVVSNQNRNRENFQQQKYEGKLPNVDVPNKITTKIPPNLTPKMTLRQNCPP